MKQLIIISIVVYSFSSCLDVQENYEYKPSNISNQVNMNAWEFIKSRPDIFSQLVDVVRTSGMDSTLYYSNSEKIQSIFCSIMKR